MASNSSIKVEDGNQNMLHVVDSSEQIFANEGLYPYAETLFKLLPELRKGMSDNVQVGVLEGANRGLVGYGAHSPFSVFPVAVHLDLAENLVFLIEHSTIISRPPFDFVNREILMQWELSVGSFEGLLWRQRDLVAEWVTETSSSAAWACLLGSTHWKFPLAFHKKSPYIELRRSLK